jgi:hypothetical protein
MPAGGGRGSSYVSSTIGEPGDQSATSLLPEQRQDVTSALTFWRNMDSVSAVLRWIALIENAVFWYRLCTTVLRESSEI